MMAERRDIPHIVHGPEQPFIGSDARYLGEGEHALVDPVENHGVGSAHEGMCAQREPVGGYGDFEKVLPAEATCAENAQVLGVEWQTRTPAWRGEEDMRVVGAFVDDEHDCVVSEVP